MSWLALALLLGVALAFAARGPSSRSPAAAQAVRVTRITSEIRCPTCKGLSAAESDAELAKAIRAEVASQVSEGRTDGQILGFVSGRYGNGILLRPPASGVDGLVWGLPVAAFVVTAVALAFAFRRWRRQIEAEASPADRALVARELGGFGG